MPQNWAVFRNTDKDPIMMILFWLFANFGSVFNIISGPMPAGSPNVIKINGIFIVFPFKKSNLK